MEIECSPYIKNLGTRQSWMSILNKVPWYKTKVECLSQIKYLDTRENWMFILDKVPWY
jgi:hypothetical protein